MVNLSKKLGEMEFDGLITDLLPHVQTGGGIIAKIETETTYKRGTVLGKSEDGKLSIYDGTTTPDCILCDGTVVGTDEDTNVVVYIAGCFDPRKVTVAEGYTLTAADIDKFRERGIKFKAASPGN